MTWASLLMLVGFFGAVYTIYADLKSPIASHLTRGSYRELLAAILHGRMFAPHWPGTNGAEFDPDLVYVLKPGVGRFHGPEFDVTAEVTPARMRITAPGDPAELRPGLVVLVGDSFTYGFGVKDGETFSSVLQTRYQHRTVNLGVPSYGTARELLWLRRVGLLAQASVVVIQYCGNDAPENREFLRRAEARAPIDDPRAFWDRLSTSHKVDVTYGRVLSGVVKYLRERAGEVGVRGVVREVLRDRHPSRRQYRHSIPNLAGDFLAVLDRFPELAAKTVVVTDMNPFGEVTGIMEELEKRCADRPNIKLVPLRFEPADYFRFDAHLNARGHASAAEQLDRALRALDAGVGADQPRR